MGRRPLLRAKLIIGICLAHPFEDMLSHIYPVIPAILDTGFNRVLQIDQRYLDKPVYDKEYVKSFKKEAKKHTEKTTGRKCFNMPIKIWITPVPYEHTRKRTWLVPFPLSVTESMQVVVPASPADKRWPPLPLLGFVGLETRIRASDQVNAPGSRRGWPVVHAQAGCRFAEALSAGGGESAEEAA